MITTADLLNAVTAKLGENFPEVRIWSTDKDKDFGKKCFFIKYSASRDGKPEFVHDYGQIRLYYFPSDKNVNRMELLDMQERLSELFLFRIFVNYDFAVPINELEFEIDDDVLVMSFDFDMYQMPEEDITPAMEELEVN